MLLKFLPMESFFSDWFFDRAWHRLGMSKSKPANEREAEIYTIFVATAPQDSFT